MPTHRERMPEREAMDYYNAKIYRFWLTQMDWIAKSQKEKVLHYLLGRTTPPTSHNKEKR